MEKHLHIVTLGCARNQVDSEVMAGELKRAGWILVDQPESAQAIVVNTCSFIAPAADEAIDTILALAQFKHKGSCQRLIVTGCLPERYREAIKGALSEVDVFLGTGAYHRIVEAVGKMPDETYIGVSTCPAKLKDPEHICTKNIQRQRDRLKAYLTDCLKKGIKSR